MRRSRIFCWGGGGEGVQTDGQKNSLNNFFSVFFFSPQLILQFTEGVQWLVITEKTILFEKSRGVQHLTGEVQLLPGVQMLISIETHITCDFSGGVRTPIPPPPPLDPRMIFHTIILSRYSNMQISDYSWLVEI